MASMSSARPRTDTSESVRMSSVATNDTSHSRTNQQRKVSVHSLTQMEKSVKHHADKDALFVSIHETIWTVADHHRLYAVDRLQTRMMEYHNNIHRRGRVHHALASSNVQPNDVVAFMMTCSGSVSDKTYQAVEKISLPSVVKKVKGALKNTSPGVTLPPQWIHLMDLSALQTIGEELNLDPMCVDHFNDLRFHSMLMPLLGGCCASICYFQLDNCTLNVSVFKMYFYMTEGLIITFVAELVPDVDLATGDVHTMQNMLRPEVSGEEVPVPLDAVFNAVVDRWESLADRVAANGPMQVFYELASETLIAQDTLLEFLSRSIFHFKKKTSFRLPYRRKLRLVKRLRVVITAINIMESCTTRAAAVVSELTKSVTDRSFTHLLAPTPAHLDAPTAPVLSMDALIPHSILGVKQLPILCDLLNSYAFANSCLANETKEVHMVNTAIDSISQMRADHTALVLSLIATIFLPATFLTGVFGMNFQEHGGYTIEIVNSHYGPTVFYALCVVLAVSLCIYYISMGWIEAFSGIRLLVMTIAGKRNMMWLLGDDFEEDINDDPEESQPAMVNVSPLLESDNNNPYMHSQSFTDDGAAGISLSNDGGADGHVGATTVRSPFSSATSGSASSSNPPPQPRSRSTAQPPQLVSVRVAEALQVEARRQEETAARRQHASFHGSQPPAALPGSARNSSYQRPSLQQRSRQRLSRMSAASVDNTNFNAGVMH
mmetsp:Transcript_36751/g.63435  ORF Transcript_36751/g.63435 Transcript_36751/m.63435 type:complete len:718 (-) Transcript_36751:164-2317(-)